MHFLSCHAVCLRNVYCLIGCSVIFFSYYFSFSCFGYNYICIYILSQIGGSGSGYGAYGGYSSGRGGGSG